MLVSDVKGWVSYLPFKMQAVLLSALRGPDGVTKESAAKPLVRRMRSVLLHPAGDPSPSNQFMYSNCGQAEVERFLGDLDPYNVHWLVHFAHAAEIIGYCHHDPVEAGFWRAIYLGIVDAFHMNPETHDQLCERLKGDYGPLASTQKENSDL